MITGQPPTGLAGVKVAMITSYCTWTPAQFAGNTCLHILSFLLLSSAASETDQLPQLREKGNTLRPLDEVLIECLNVVCL